MASAGDEGRYSLEELAVSPTASLFEGSRNDDVDLSFFGRYLVWARAGDGAGNTGALEGPRRVRVGSRP